LRSCLSSGPVNWDIPRALAWAGSPANQCLILHLFRYSQADIVLHVPNLNQAFDNAK
jgi:hypothetical protein